MKKTLKNSLIAGSIVATIAAGGVGLNQVTKNCLLDEVALTTQDAKKCFKTEQDYQVFKKAVLGQVQGDSMALYGEDGDDLLAIMVEESKRGNLGLDGADLAKTIEQL